MKRISKLAALLLALAMTFSLAGCGGSTNSTSGAAEPAQQGSDGGKTDIVIYSPNEDYLIEFYLSKLTEQFPDYNITIEYLSTGKLAAKLAAEDADTDCDIIIGMSYGYLDSLRDNLAPIDFVDTSVFMSDLLQADSKYIPWDRFSGATIVNTDILA